MYRIALADSFHLHNRSFPSLFKALEKMKATVITLLEKGSDGYSLIQCTGNYDDLDACTTPMTARAITSQATVMSRYTADELYQAEVINLRLWPLCRSEMLAYLLTLDNWQQDVMPKDDRAIFDKAFAENPDVLALNMAMASYWLNHWNDSRKDLFQCHFCCVFSGSMTYVRSLMELLRRSPTKVFVLESTFTGNDFIFEEMYHPVANNLGVRNPTLRASRREAVLEQPNQYDREVIKARNKILSAKNKNVVQPEWSSLPEFPERREQVLIVGQVANDFSLIEDGFPYVASIPVYRELIRQLLDETDCNIVFKAHPWENKKEHLRSPKTFDALAEFVLALPDAQRARVMLVEDVNLHSLIETSQYFVTFCSQAAIEAALLGLRPIILGTAFYSGAGFTEDCPDIAAVVQAVSTGPGLLDMDGYKAVDRFLVDLFQYGTVSIFDSGEAAIRRQLTKPTPLEQKTLIRKELALGSTQEIERIPAQYWSGVIRKKIPLDDLTRVHGLQKQLNILLSDFSSRMSSAQGMIKLPVRIINNSDYIVPVEFRGRAFKLSYHIFDANGGRFVWNGETTALPSDIRQGLNGHMNFNVPNQPGTYQVMPALLLPGFCWLDSDKKWEISVE